MKKTISVVVPVYNVEKYLRKCIDCILAQTYKNLEIILVDDGATDLSGQICDDYAAKFGNVNVIHKENGGLSDARNVGLAHAAGEYICFFDSDDWVEPNILEAAHLALTEKGADVAIWGFYKDFVDENEQILRSDPTAVQKMVCVREHSDYQGLMNECALSLVGYAWNKLYQRRILEENGFCFEKGVSLVEDILFNSLVLGKAKSIILLDELGTHYIQRERETLGTKFYPNYFALKIMACEARERLLQAYGATEQEIKEIISREYFAGLKSSCRMACKSLDKKESLAYMKSICESKSGKKIIDGCDAKGKDGLIKLVLRLRMYDVFRMLYV